jgi:hypothetical protein
VPPNELRIARTHSAVRVRPCFVLITVIVLILPAWGAQKSKDEEMPTSASAARRSGRGKSWWGAPLGLPGGGEPLISPLNTKVAKHN